MVSMFCFRKSLWSSTACVKSISFLFNLVGPLASCAIRPRYKLCNTCRFGLHWAFHMLPCWPWWLLEKVALILCFRFTLTSHCSEAVNIDWRALRERFPSRLVDSAINRMSSGDSSACLFDGCIVTALSSEDMQIRFVLRVGHRFLVACSLVRLIPVLAVDQLTSVSWPDWPILCLTRFVLLRRSSARPYRACSAPFDLEFLPSCQERLKLRL